jgi:hypothetical protein
MIDPADPSADAAASSPEPAEPSPGPAADGTGSIVPSTEPVEPSQAPEAGAVRRRKLPLAVSVVSLLVGLVAFAALVLSGFYLLPLAVCGQLNAQILEDLDVPRPCVPPQEAGMIWDLDETIVPAEFLPDAAYWFVTALVLVVLLIGLRRLRRWAWVALMGWAGLNLAFGLFRYFSFSEDEGRPFFTFALNSIIVLALNMEEMQQIFGIRAKPARPLRQTSAVPEVER